MSRLVSFAVLIAIIIVIGLLFYKVLIGFFIPVFLAAVLVVVFRPLHRWVLNKVRQRVRIAAAVTTLLIILTLFLPIVVVGTAAGIQGLRLIRENDASTVKLRVELIRDSLGLQMPPYEDTLRLVGKQIGQIVEQTDNSLVAKENPSLVRIGTRTVETLKQLQALVQQRDGPKRDAQFDVVIAIAESVGKPSEEPFGPSQTAVKLKSEFTQLKVDLLGGSLMTLVREKANPTKDDIDELIENIVDYAQPRLLSITGATGTFVIKFIFGSIILTVATFFFLYDGPSMVKTIMHLSPLDDSYEQELLLEFDRISRAVVLATILSAIVQGLTAGLGYAVAGAEYLVLLVMLTTVFAMVPFVGPAVIWVPVCLYLGVYEGRMTAAIALAMWGVLVVGTVDNLVKAFVLHGQSQLHPLLALLSVLGGVQTLGPIGIVVGPMVVVMLQTLLSILQRELVLFEDHKLVLSTGGVRASEATSGNEQADDSSTSGVSSNGVDTDEHRAPPAESAPQKKSQYRSASEEESDNKSSEQTHK